MNKTGKGGFSDNPKNINRNGRPKGVNSIPDLLRRIGEESVPDDLAEALNEKFDADLSELTMQEAVLRSTFAYAVSGKAWAVQFIADRMEGKPVMKMQVESHEPIQLLRTGIDEIDNPDV
mgnify:CR=1 FL=1|tara:strand:+ start:408 stop:767 length:360 start_codon:yes stop_codon:yes gene_type:complete